MLNPPSASCRACVWQISGECWTQESILTKRMWILTNTNHEFIFWMWWTRHSSGILERMTHSNSKARNGPVRCRERWARCGRRRKSLAIGKRKKHLRSTQMATLMSGCRSATWRWNPSCGKFEVTRTLIGNSTMSNTRTECAVLSSSALSDKTCRTINIYICTHTWEWNTQKGGWWGSMILLVTSHEYVWLQ